MAVATVASLVVIVALMALSRTSTASARPTPRSDDVSRLVTSAALDQGPWPTAGHDMRRSQQSHLSGPGRGSAVRTFHEPSDPHAWSSAEEPGAPVLAVTSDRRVLIGECGRLRAVSLTGAEQWQLPLVDDGRILGVAGLAVDAAGRVLVTTRGCPDADGAAVARRLVLDYAGRVLVAAPQAASRTPPAIAPSRDHYTIDGTGVIRAFAFPDGPLWAQDLPGFSVGAMALDSGGNLYVGTDGSRYNQPSLWSVRPDGRVRWADNDDELSSPVVSPQDRVYVAGVSSGQLHAYDTDGHRRWSVPVGATAGLMQCLAVGRSETVYVRSAVGLTAVRPDGGVAWTFTGGPSGSVPSTAVLDKDENVYVSVGDAVHSFTPRGARRWTVPLVSAGPLVLADEGVLLAVSRSRRVVAIGDAR